MASREVSRENSNMSGSDKTPNQSLDHETQINHMVLLFQIEHVDGRPIEPEVLTEATFRDLCISTNPLHKPQAVEVLSLHEICFTYKQGIILGHVAGELMVIESWMDFPILITVVIIKRSKVDVIVEARQQHRQVQKEKEQEELAKLKQGQYDLQDELDQITVQREKLAQQLLDHDEKQGSLLKVVKQLTEKVTKLETQPLHTQGFMTSSSQNVSNPFGNLSTSFQVKADIDLGKFSGTKPTPPDELNFDKLCINVKSFQASYPDSILLLAVRKSIVGKAKSVIRHLGPSYTVDEVITILTQEYEGVAGSDLLKIFMS